MVKKNEFALKELISLFLRQNNLSKDVARKNAEKAWHSISGELISKLTINVKVYESTMYIKLMSPALRQELTFKQEELVTRINEYVGENVIKKIVFN